MKNTNPPANKHNKPTNTLPAKAKNPEFDRLLALKSIDHAHLNSLPPDERKKFVALLNKKLKTAKDVELDTFVDQIGPIIDADHIWEMNHSRITIAIQEFIEKTGSVPAKSQLAQATGLSRPTIHKHLRSFAANPAYQERTESFNIMNQEVLGRVLLKALQGDMAAAKLYLHANTTKQAAGKDIVINNQNNYIQINNTVLNQEVIQKLKPEQLQKIEDIIKASLRKEQG